MCAHGYTWYKSRVQYLLSQKVKLTEQLPDHRPAMEHLSTLSSRHIQYGRCLFTSFNLNVRLLVLPDMPVENTEILYMCVLMCIISLF